jgi:NAD(P)-dependent dehydrogenase (short-subunit alcohol dehydrogenase family)
MLIWFSTAIELTRSLDSEPGATGSPKLWRKARFRDDEYRCISNAILFLASDEPRYITGVSLPVDAGGLLKQSTTEAEMTNA